MFYLYMAMLIFCLVGVIWLILTLISGNARYQHGSNFGFALMFAGVLMMPLTDPMMEMACTIHGGKLVEQSCIKGSK